MSAVSKLTKQLDVGEVGQARHHGYVLFGRLLAEGLTPELLPYVEQVPELAAAVPKFYDEDIAAAHHQAIFGFNLFPFQSIFLDVTGLAGGKEARRVQKFYGKVGFELDRAVGPDHGAQLLLCLAVLCEEGSKRGRQQQAELLGQHLLCWLLPFTCALKQQKRDFYTALTDLLLALVADHAGDLAEDLGEQRAFKLAQPPDILGNKKSGWKEIAAFLLTPPYTGIYLGREDIGNLAKDFKLPRGFGERQQMLVNLFQSAIVYDGFVEVMTGLRRITAVYQSHYSDNLSIFPHDAALGNQWQSRAGQTVELLNKLQTLIA
jgi:TorA maturation chaperone TorD